MASDMPAAYDPPAWKVIGQTTTSAMGPNGVFVPSVKVTFQLEDGTTGSVTVPASAYTLANVRAAVTEHAAQLAAVSKLNSQS